MSPNHHDGGAVTAPVNAGPEPALDLEHLTAYDLGALSADECAIVGIVARLQADGDAAPLRAWAREAAPRSSASGKPSTCSVNSTCRSSSTWHWTAWSARMRARSVLCGRVTDLARPGH